MENLGKIILLLISIIVLIVIALIIIGYVDKKDKEANFENTLTMEIANTIDYVKNRNEFFAVKSCITKYLLYITQKDNEIIYSMLDKNYLEEYKITEQTVLSNIEEYKNPIFCTDRMYVIQNKEAVYTYFVYGTVIDKETSKNTKLNIVIRLDKQKDLFSIIPYEYIEDKKYNIQVGNNVTFKYDEIKDNIYNKFAFKNITDEEMAIFYMDEIKNSIVYDKETLYNKLNSEYREDKFINLQEYKSYINKNITKIYSAKVQKYRKEKYKDYTQYVCIDQNENYYIINEVNPGQYEVILDTYTIDLPEYIEKYNKATNNEKVALCIDKFIKNINAENYTLAYSMLNESFKKNYFKTQADFENYAKKNFLGKESIEYKNIQNEGNIYIYLVNLSSKINDIGSIEKNFNVKLGEGTNFELSFNME